MSASTRTLLGLLACCGATPSQDSPFVELRRWHWRGPDVLCGAYDAASATAAYGTREGTEAWALVLYDPRERRELRRFQLGKRPVAVRLRDTEHVEVRWPDSNAFLSLSHWHRLRRSDGVEVGDPVLSRIEDEDPVAHAQFRGRESMGLESGLCLGSEGTLYWWQQGKPHAVTDRLVRDLVWTPDARFLLVWLPSRLVVVTAADGTTKQLPVHSEEVLAVAGGSNGDEVVVVDALAAHVFRASSGRELRTVRHPGEPVFAVASVPGDSALAIARGSRDDAVLLDLQSGRSTAIDTQATDIAWSPDGRRLACVGSRGFACFDRAGQLLWDDDQGAWMAYDARKQAGLVWADPLNARQYTMRWHLLVFDDDTAALCSPHGSIALDRRASTPESRRLELEPWGSLGTHELVATKGSRLVVCDGAWQPQAEVDVGTPIGKASVARAARRVAFVAGAHVHMYDILPRDK